MKEILTTLNAVTDTVLAYRPDKNANRRKAKRRARIAASKVVLSAK